MKRFTAYLAEFSQTVLTIETAVKRLSFEEKEGQKTVKMGKPTEQVNGLGNIYVRKRIF